MQEDLVAVRMNAHLDYILPRITNTDKQLEFLKTMRDLINKELPNPVSKNGGAELAYNTYLEILYTNMKRFEEGRQKAPFYLEKV